MVKCTKTEPKCLTVVPGLLIIRVLNQTHLREILQFLLWFLRWTTFEVYHVTRPINIFPAVVTVLFVERTVFVEENTGNLRTRKLCTELTRVSNRSCPLQGDSLLRATPLQNVVLLRRSGN